MGRLSGRGAWRLLAVAVLTLAAARVRAQGACEATEHGMRADGSDNVAALTRTLAECAGNTIHIAAGTYTFSPSGFAPGLKIPAGTHLIGDGSHGERATVLRIADSGTFMGFLWIRNVSDVSLEQLRFEGTSYPSGCTAHDYGHAIWIQSDPGDGPAVSGIRILGNAFHNFNGQAWISVSAEEGSPGVSQVMISGNAFVSDAGMRGGCAGSAGLNYPVEMISLHGSNLSAHGLLVDTSVVSNTFDAGYVKSAVAVWSGTARITIQNNTIRDSGLNLPVVPNTDLGRYAIVIYNSAHLQPGLHPDSVLVAGNEISNPYSCGVYVASGQDIEITGNRISGQRDRYDGTLPKGGIALANATVRTLKDNQLSNNYIGISAAHTPVAVEDNQIVAAPGGMRTKITP